MIRDEFGPKKILSNSPVHAGPIMYISRDPQVLGDLVARTLRRLRPEAVPMVGTNTGIGDRDGRAGDQSRTGNVL